MHGSYQISLKVDVLSFLSSSSDGYIFLKFLSNSKWLFIADRSSIKQSRYH